MLERADFLHYPAYRDGKVVVVPNGKIIAGNIINFSREPARRNEFIIGVSYDADIDKVKQLLTSIIESDDRILRDREMTVRLNELGASSVNFVVRVWSKSSDLQNVYWDILERIKREFLTPTASALIRRWMFIWCVCRKKQSKPPLSDSGRRCRLFSIAHISFLIND